MSTTDCVEGMRSLTLNSVQEHSVCHAFLGPRMTARVNKPDEYRRHLYHTRLCFGITIDALMKMQQGLYEANDALVSECQCHLRAIRICRIAESFRRDPAMQATVQVTLRQLFERITVIDKELLQNWARFPKAPLQELLKDIDVKLEEWMVFVSQTRLLTMTKCVEGIFEACSETGCTARVDTTREISSVEPLCKLEPKLSCGMLEEWIKGIKAQVAESSVRYLMSQASRISPLMQRMLTPANTRMIEGRMELPCAYSLSAAFQLCMHDGMAILLKVQRAEHYLEEVRPRYDVMQLYVPKNGRYEISTSPLNPDQPLIVLEGRRAGRKEFSEPTNEYVARLNKFSLEQLVEWNAAQHDQFTKGMRRITHIPLFVNGQNEEESRRLSAVKKEAKANGCSFKNQSLLLLTHMFVGTVRTHGVINGGTSEPN